MTALVSESMQSERDWCIQLPGPAHKIEGACLLPCLVPRLADWNAVVMAGASVALWIMNWK